jgi:nitrite reductase (NO-forming)
MEEDAMQRVGLLTAAVVAAVLFSAACSNSPAGTGTSGATTGTPSTAASAAAQQVTLTTGNAMSFDPSSITVRAGQPVQLTLRNEGQMVHDFTLADGVAQPVKVTAMAGQTASGTFTIDTPGTYSFDCSMPGHAGAGMRGTILAQ